LNHKIKVILAIALSTLIAGCGKKVNEGVYVNSRNPDSYLELTSGGDYIMKKPAMKTDGTYESKGDSITLISRAGELNSCQRKGDTLADENGEYWVLWHGGTTGAEYESGGKAAPGGAGQAISSIEDNIVTDLTNLGADAYQYKVRPAAMGGGGSSYEGYTIPANGGWGPANPNAAYTVISQTSSSLVLMGASKLISGATVTITFDGDGKVTSGPAARGF
jgi:hypothetical protein